MVTIFNIGDKVTVREEGMGDNEWGVVRGISVTQKGTKYYIEFDKFPFDLWVDEDEIWTVKSERIDWVKSEKVDLKEAVKETLSKQDDAVNHPSHYTSGKIEVIDFIEDQKLSYHLGNAIKYICRAGKKDPSKTVEDLHKAVWYINRYAELIQKEGLVCV